MHFSKIFTLAFAVGAFGEKAPAHPHLAAVADAVAVALASDGPIVRGRGADAAGPRLAPEEVRVVAAASAGGDGAGAMVAETLTGLRGSAPELGDTVSDGMRVVRDGAPLPPLDSSVTLARTVTAGAGAASDLRVHELYTFGGPSVTRDPITARGNCVPGLRLYNENVMDWSKRHPSDFAAMFNQDLGHPKMAMLMLNNRQSKFWNHNGGRNTAKYVYKPCKDSEGNQHHYWWPKNQIGNTKIHGLNEAYLPRLKHFFFGEDEITPENLWTQTPIDNGVPEDLIKSALLYGTMAQFNYAATEPACASSSDCPKDQDKCPDSSPCYGACSNGRCDGWVTWAMKDEAKNAFPPGWELIKQGEVFSGNKAAGAEDRDNIKLYKFTATNECVFTFEGSNIEKNGGIQYDLGRFTGHGAGNMVTWCGKKNLHRGVKDELWTIIHSAAYADFKPELAACQKVTCAGHSLGGALCDMWTHLANNGVEDSSDTSCWTKLQWWQ